MSKIESDPCLSSKDHRITDIRNLRSHFFGCIPIAHRLKFLKDAKNLSDAADNVSGSEIEANPTSIGGARESFKVAEHIQYTAALALDGDIKRIDMLRNHLKDLTDNVKGSCQRWRESRIYKDNIRAVKTWRESKSQGWAFSKNTINDGSSPQGEEQTRNINWGPSGRSGLGAPEDERVRGGTETLPSPQPEDQPNPADVARLEVKSLADVSSTDITKRLSEIIKKYQEENGFQKTDKQILKNDNKQEYNLEKDVKAQFIQLQREPYAEVGRTEDVGVMKPISKSLHDHIYTGHFPDQQLSIEELTVSQFLHNPVHQVENEKAINTHKRKGKEADTGTSSQKNAAHDRDPTVRYFHMPYNNMMWVEKAMKCYFDKEETTSSKRSGLVLRPQLWRGQEHGSGGDNIVHCRHLRSLCETFSTDSNNSHENKNHGNMVLFMPFLHWENDRMRSIIAERIDREIDRQVQDLRSKEQGKRKDRQDFRKGLPNTTLDTIEHSDPNYYKEKNKSTEAVPRIIEDILWEELRKEKTEGSETGKLQFKPSNVFFGVPMDASRRLRSTNPLAQYLVDAARLFEAMATYQDSELIKTYLFQNPPLHPRRSLDQAYFWKLRNTHRRDRDQVVYRFTHSTFTHRLLPPSRSKQDLKRMDQVASSNGVQNQDEQSKLPSVLEGWEWKGHGQYEDKNGCEHCKNDIRKLSRAVMVDQLWMWILDNDTVLTCFPQRYGISKKDPSGVHQSIRTRLKDQTNPRYHVRSVFDLGLIILDEAFNVFFDRTKISDKRPQVLDIFAESIGNVLNKQTIGFRQLRKLTEQLATIYRSPIDKDIPDRLVLPLLNITKEIKLQREIRDILDELDIIMHIVRQQEEVITKYIAKVLDMSQINGTTNSNERPSIIEQIRFNSDGTWSLVPKNPTRKPTFEKVQEWEATIQEQQHKSFEKNSNMLVGRISETTRELKGLKKAAETAAQNVNDLITMKQEQASVVQAYQAMKQGEETVRQGRAIMLFTAMTIIFLPLSFMTSLFGMNAVELTGSGDGDNSLSPTSPIPNQSVDLWATTFKRQIAIMFSVSFCVICLALILAFSPPIRSFIASFIEWLFVVIKVRSGLYKFWVAKDIDISYELRMRKWKNYQKEESVVKQRQRQKLRKRWEDDGVDTMTEKRSLEGLGITHGELANEIRAKVSKAMEKISFHSRQNLLRRRKVGSLEDPKPANGDVEMSGGC